MKRIPLTREKFTLVDDEDYDYLVNFKWQAQRNRNSRTYYARSSVMSGNKRIGILMHRIVMFASKDMEIDHRDRNGLNNQKSNLRLCTSTENHRNVGIRTDNKSGFKGVSWCKGSKKWKAQLRFEGRKLCLGYYFCLIKAARAYDEASRKYFGEYANPNFKEIK